ncbi:MAG: 50S ribosomal protein L20, partial [Alphaproteobacteria bacterium]|nr:50S ribosomal protein L20 [Alphaproteobacteria bacterium]
MSRAKGGTVARKSHKKVMKQAKGYFSRRKNIFRVAVQAVEKAEQYAYR